LSAFPKHAHTHHKGLANWRLLLPTGDCFNFPFNCEILHHEQESTLAV